MDSETIARLGASPIFGGLSEPELQACGALMFARPFDVGTVIVKAGDLGHEIFWIDHGEVEVVSGAGVPVAHLGPGDVCGEMAFIEIAPRSASIVGATAGQLQVFHARDLSTLRKARPETFSFIVLNIARELSRRLRHADDEISSLRAALAMRD